jgi:hypothetical protein
MSKDSSIDAPAQYRTPQRPGQSGEQAERRDGASPLSDNPTGPHPPYDVDDPSGLAAGKHQKPNTKSGHRDSKLAKSSSPPISRLS